MPMRIHGQFEFVSEAEFVQDGRQVVFDCGFGDVKLFCDKLAIQPFGNQLNNLPLAGSQRRDLFRVRIFPLWRSLRPQSGDHGSCQ